MRQCAAPKEGHKGFCERCEALEELRYRPFSTDRVAYQQCQTIEWFVAAEAAAHQRNLVRQGIQQSFGRQVLRDDDDFGKPGGN